MTATDNEMQTIVETAIATTDPRELEPGKIYGWALPGGAVHQIDLTGDEYRDQPKHKAGKVYVDDLDSFLHYYQKHSDDGTEIYVNITGHYLTAVLDANQGGADGARWGQHRLVLTLPTTDRWDAWMAMNGKPFAQSAFAEFVEEHVDDIRDPNGATMLEVVQNFQTATKVRFTSNVRLDNGNHKLHFEETTDATAGNSGNIAVPTAFKIGVAPFEFADPYEISARFRYRVENGKLLVAYLLDDPAAVIRDAVLDVVKQVEEATKGKVMHGTPA
ncbi:MAG TPA: DUF2303 family protein [Streptosporangiaceae bacterium]|jgi:uncharacterized protein YfdQ (DUF2303 family)|nr:DUF2303 family protein [Streptosporangiaceae bacterium]